MLRGVAPGSVGVPHWVTAGFVSDLVLLRRNAERAGTVRRAQEAGTFNKVDTFADCSIASCGFAPWSFSSLDCPHDAVTFLTAHHWQRSEVVRLFWTGPIVNL